MIRISSFNVENLFARPKAFDSSDPAVAEPILNAYRDVNALIAKPQYTNADKTKIRDLLVVLDIYYRNAQGVIRKHATLTPQWAWLRANRGKFDREPKDTTQNVEIVAAGRSAWVGWIELAKEPVNEVATQMTAKVIKDLNADIQALIEAEDRPSLVRFNQELMSNRFRHAMLVDGNDDRGIDVAILTKSGFEIDSIRSNVDNKDATGLIFSRDCAEYEVRSPGGTVIHVLVNHFKSQSGGGAEKRRRQATEVRRIADSLMQQGRHVIVLGDLNEGPKAGTVQAANLAKLYSNNSQLVDVYSLPNFDPGNKPGTFDSCSLSNRFDYIFISKSLQPSFAAGGLFRKGLWGSRQTKPDKWVIYNELKEPVQQASDHAAIFIDLNLP
jgi:endonuclease/exonuclease/phosphatase family metal-dependent hydrolase